MAANKGGAFSYKNEHAIATEVAAYGADVVVAASDEYGRMGDGASGSGTNGAEGLTGVVVDVKGASSVVVMCKVTAVAAHAGATVFEFSGSVDGTNYSGSAAAVGVSEENQYATVSVDGPTGAAGTVYETAVIDVRGLSKLKLTNIDNTIVAVAITANCTISKVN